MDTIHGTLKPSPFAAKFSCLKEESQDTPISPNGLTAGCWRRRLCSLIQGALMVFLQRKAPPLCHCQLRSLLVAPLQFEPGHASSKAFTVQASRFVNKCFVNIQSMWSAVQFSKSALGLCETYSHVNAQRGAPVLCRLYRFSAMSTSLLKSSSELFGIFMFSVTCFFTDL